MTRFVLVHGAYHGAWCWHKVVPELEARGHDVVTLDLPAHGIDTTPVGEVSVDGYVTRVCAAIDDQKGSVVLVGHSMAGIVVTAAAERRPDAVDTVVYLTAYLPGDGDSMLDHRVERSLISRKFVVDEERDVGIIPEEALEELFYADCSTTDLALARSLVRAEPLAPLREQVDVSDANYGRVPRAYIKCTEDRAITHEKQESMLADRGADEIRSLDASHSPFLSIPAETADTLEAVAPDE